MSPQAGDGPTSPDSSRSGGFANVFRGLTTSRSSRSLPLSSSSSSVALPVADIVTATPTTSLRLSPHSMDSFELLRNGSLTERVAAANTLKYAISEYPLNPVLDIWYAGKDLIDPSKPAVARTAGWELLTECVKHASSTDLERKEYFQTLAAPAHPEDFHLQLAAFVDLTHGGRTLNGFDYELLPVLNHWIREGYKAVRAARKVANAAARSQKSAKNRVVVTGEEKNFAQLFAFLKDVLRFSFKMSDDAAIGGLIDVLLEICVSTSVEDDICSSIQVLDTVVTFGTLPSDRLKNCIQTLSSIYCLVTGLQKQAWHTIANICRSHHGQATVRILLDVLRGLTAESLKNKDMSREIRGSLAVLQKLLSKNIGKGYPLVPYALLVDGLSATVRASSSAKIRTAALSVINSLFHDAAGGLHRMIAEEDWSIVLDVAAECYEDQTDEDHATDPVKNELLLLIEHLESLLSQKTADFIPRQSVIGFFIDVHGLLPDSAACAVLDYFQEFRCCSPSDLDWDDNLNLVLNGFFGNRRRSSDTRLRALRILMDAYKLLDLVEDDSQQYSIPDLVRSVIDHVADESDVPVLDAVMVAMDDIATTCSTDLFDYIVSAMQHVIDSDRLKAPVTAGLLAGSVLPLTPTESARHSSEQSPSNVIANAFARIFIQVINSNGEKAVKLFTSLVQLVKATKGETDARLTAMKLLFRLRADWANRIFLTKELDTNFLASTIGRTESAMATRRPDEAPHNGLRQSHSDHGGLSRSTRGVSFGQAQAQERGIPLRSASGVRPTVASTYRNLWKLPDPDALPSPVPSLMSPALTSHRVANEDETLTPDNIVPNMSALPLDMASWLEVVLDILRGSDWEVYSFVLVHLPSQLSNHAIFTDAIPQIEELRKLICEQIRTNKYQEPPNASGLRRGDVAICLFHSLTMILSYHEHFQKGEEDEIVQTFVRGITASERTAQCCIHALSICCHELPLSASKSLGQMLNQMAAIITQPNVAIHILEFLASLSRLPSVYVNFREDEYRTVFGICFRYLDYAREKREQSQRGQHASEPSTPAASYPLSADVARPSASDDLPQYVYALAYHVILFWFLALKLPDRATHVGTIIKRLCTDANGSGNMTDEEAITTIDFMQRATYADIDESAEDPLFNQERFGELATRHWVIGNSIITVTQAIKSGWAQITKRQPSGTSAYMIRENMQPPPLHQVDYNEDVGAEQQPVPRTVLPSYLVVQLLSTLPQSHDRPIPLPADDSMERMMRVFDRIPAVDGHKVGVIYIGEGQSDEREILANVSGTSDYVDFLNNLGTLTRLKGAKFNTQGLDREFDSDGQYTFCWRDRLTEIVFHVTTQMPTDLERDHQLAMKKRHIGNDFVNIIFNDSGLPFRFDTFPSQFNYVNIVITPASRASFTATREAQKDPETRQSFYRVQVMSKPGFPEISPASETKIVSLKALPAFIRLLALNASVFSLVWQNRTGGEHVSSWRGRLREIKKLRDKYGSKAVSTGQQLHTTSPSPPPMSSGGGSIGTGSGLAPQQQAQQINQQQQQHPGQGDSGRPSSSVRDSFTSLRRTSVATFFTSTTGSEQPSHRSSVLSGSVGTTETEVGGAAQGVDSVVDSVNFSKWA